MKFNLLTLSLCVKIIVLALNFLSVVFPKIFPKLRRRNVTTVLTFRKFGCTYDFPRLFADFNF